MSPLKNIITVIKINHGCKTVWTEAYKKWIFCVLIKIYASLNEITQKFNHLFREGMDTVRGWMGRGDNGALAEIYLLALISPV